MAKKTFRVVLLAAAAGAVGWFFLLRPEQINEEFLISDFALHQQSYRDLAGYLTDKGISTEITDIPISGQKYPNVNYEDTKPYTAFMDAAMKLMSENRDRITSDGKTVEFVIHSTGGTFTRKTGSLYYTVADGAPKAGAQPMSEKGWYYLIGKD